MKEKKPVPPGKPDFLARSTQKEPFMRRLKDMKHERSPLEADWREIIDHTAPMSARFLGERGKPRSRQNIINSTGTLSWRTVRSGLYAGASSQTRPWFRYGPKQHDLKERASVKDYCSKAERITQAILQASNFYPSIHSLYGDLANIGNAAMVFDKNFDTVMSCQQYAIGEFYFGLNGSGDVRYLYREFAKTVQQMIDDYGDRCSKRVLKMYDEGNYGAWVDVVHVIEPNYQQIKGVYGPRGMPYVSIYFEPQTDDNEDKCLEVKGYKSWPAATPRWDLCPGDIYAFGCGHEAKGDLRALQMLEREKAILIKKSGTPPIQGPISAKAGGASHIPGRLSYYSDTTGPTGGFRSMYDINPAAIQHVGNEIQRHERRAQQAYYYDLFLRISSDERLQRGTATEMTLIKDEQMVQIGPVLGRLHVDCLNVAITRAFETAQEAGIMPPVPEELDGVELEVTYVSTLAQAQRASEIAGMERLVAVVGNLSATFPNAKDKIDEDQFIDEYADRTMSVPNVVRSDDAVAKIRKTRAEAEQAVTAEQQGMAAVQGAKVLSETQVSPENLLGRMTGM